MNVHKSYIPSMIKAKVLSSTNALNIIFERLFSQDAVACCLLVFLDHFNESFILCNLASVLVEHLLTLLAIWKSMWVITRYLIMLFLIILCIILQLLQFLLFYHVFLNLFLILISTSAPFLPIRVKAPIIFKCQSPDMLPFGPSEIGLVLWDGLLIMFFIQADLLM